MSKKLRTVRGAKGRKLYRLGLGLPAVLAVAPAAHALELYDGTTHGNNWEVNLNITASYTGAVRLGHPNQALVNGTNNTNGNDGDSNLRGGVVNNIFEVLPVLDIKNGAFGMHFSGDYFINTVYLGTNQNDTPGSVNPIVNKNTDYADQTRNANGHNGRLLDAFVYDSWNFGDGQEFNLKAGQQTLFWGQSLFSTDGISGGQAPLDLVTAQNLVNPQSQQVFLPVGQIVATYQPNSTYTLQGYYQYQWVPYAQQGVGSYFSTTDILGPGGYRLIAAQAGGQNFYLMKGKDLTPPSQNGQFGASLQAQYGNYDAGLFMLRYDAKLPEVYINAPTATFPTPGGTAVGEYRAVYPRDIWLYGTSVSTTVGATNIAGETSIRTHDPLVGSSAAGIQSAANPGNANGDPLYPVGNVWITLVNAIYGSPALKFDPGGITLLGEFEYDNVIRVTDNPQLLAPGRSSQAASIDLEVEPAFFEVLPNLELQFPVSVFYNLAGNSQVQTSMNHGTGFYSVGVVATYKESWDASLNYQGYFGRAGSNPTVPNVAAYPVDRAYISLNLQHTF
jgi:Protein of unknown function (DUF1302)